jgi:hypothetical protein
VVRAPVVWRLALQGQLIDQGLDRGNTMDGDKAPDSPVVFGQSSQLGLRMFAWLLLAVSLWGLVTLAQLWSRPVRLVRGTPERVVEEGKAGRYQYLLPFAVDETGEVLMLRLPNSGPVIDYFISNPGTPISILYWTTDSAIASVHPLIAGEPAIRGQYPPYSALLGTSAMGIVLAVVLLAGARLDGALYRIGRG